MELQSKTTGTPLIKVKIKKAYEDIFGTLTRLKKNDGIDGVVVGDIQGAGCAQIHQTYYDTMCAQLNMKLLMLNENPSKDTYDVLKEEISAGIRPIMNCINLEFFDKNWLGRELDPDSIKELKELADSQGIDVCSEDGQGYHTMVVKAPFFKEDIRIEKFKAKSHKERSKLWKRNWFYMDIKEAALKSKA
jgi:uncharacterized protein (TIGR00290 family)